MARICLVRPLLSPTDFNGYPLNLLILAAALREAGHEPVIRDYDFLKEIDPSWGDDSFAARAAADIAATGCQYVGITAMCSNYVLAVDLAKELKKLAPELHLTFGGPHVSLCPSETLARYGVIDTAVVGEGEVTFPELIEALETGAPLDEVRGICYRRDGKPVLTKHRPLLHDLSQSPRPAYDLVDMQAYLNLAKDTYLEIYAGSGCPFTCTFCSTSLVWERKYRVMTQLRIVDEIEYLHETYGATCFNLIHDNLTVNKPFIHGIAAEIKARGLTIRWGFSSRIDTLDEETAKIVSEAGCDYIFFGVESASERIQKTMGKRLKLSMIHEAMQYCFRYGIRPTTSFILGFPNEEQEDIEATVRLAYRCKVGGGWRSFINLLSPYTGTALMRESQDRLTLDLDHINTTMVRYLYERHFDEIREDSYLYANYYFLDYSDSYLKASDYSNLVDFFTICLFKYPYTISCLINDHHISPVEVFRRFEAQIRGLTPEDRDKIRILIHPHDLFALCPDADPQTLLSALRYDQAILAASQAEGVRVLYKGTLQLAIGSQEYNIDRPLTGADTRRFLLSHENGEIATYELDAFSSLALQAQGVPVFCPEHEPMPISELSLLFSSGVDHI